MEFLHHAFEDIIISFPFLILTFILIEFIEHKFGRNINEKIKVSGKLGPIIGALLGIIPQCGFSVMGVAFFAQGCISLGTLLSIFIATSDEAIPVLLSTPGSFNKLAPLIATKLIFAILWGYIVDLVISRFKVGFNEVSVEYHKGCCGNECVYGKFKIKEIFSHAVLRSLKIGLYIFAVTVGINILFHYRSVETFTGVKSSMPYLSIITSSLFGLIPNCAVSVGLVEVYTHGILGFPELIAGLSSNAGIGLLVLFKEIKDKKKALYILLLLVVISSLSGFILSLLNVY